MAYFIDTIGGGLGGVTDAHECSIAGVLKRRSAEHHYVVANEFICGRLGLLAGLNIPPGVIVLTDEGDSVYVSLFFGGTGRQAPPPADYSKIATKEPFVAAGIVSFDCWIANTDRNPDNLAYEPSLGIPVTVFDHSHALFGPGRAGTACECLERVRGLGFSGGSLHEFMSDGGALIEWEDRFRSLSDRLIQGVCHSAAVAGAITERESEAASEFLNLRKRRTVELLKEGQENRGFLPNMTQWGLAP